MQPCQRHTDDSSAPGESSGKETKGVKSLGEGKGETVFKAKRKKKVERVWMCNNLFHCCTNTKQDSAYSRVRVNVNLTFVCVNIWLFVCLDSKGEEKVFLWVLLSTHTNRHVCV